MSSVSRPQYRPPPPPPPPPAPKLTQQTQQPHAVTEAKAADKQQSQPYVHPHDKSSFEPVTAASESQKSTQQHPQPSAATSAQAEPTDDVTPTELAAHGSQGKNGPSEARNVQQTNDVDCGVGALATVGSATHPGMSDDQLRGQVHANAQKLNGAQGQEQGLTPVELNDGITPQEMSQLAGQQGLETKSFGNFDSGALEKHVTEGNDALMLVDTNALENTQNGTHKKEGADGEHWLVVDDVRQAQGKDGQTEPVYSVKDPSTHKTYELTRDQMEHVVNAGREGENHTGGGLLVKQAQTGDKNGLSAANANTASVGTTGDDDGTGRGNSNYSSTTNIY